MRTASGAAIRWLASGIAFIGKTAIGLVCGLVSPVNLVRCLQARDYEA
ncbi:hypothetical protein BBC0122_015960 [Bartonella choladocola]|uniref:Uncharacterized protein n=1 Tax=Bartonella choladocola TaxID=2750995 RepID=A0A1U9MIY5_9HYPH|nr:hypothetical protein BBC0122_015960 [Bartonella choladocola]